MNLNVLNIFENLHYKQSFNIQINSPIGVQSLANMLVKVTKTYENISNQLRLKKNKRRPKGTVINRFTPQTIPVSEYHDFLTQIEIQLYDYIIPTVLNINFILFCSHFLAKLKFNFIWVDHKEGI